MQKVNEIVEEVRTRSVCLHLQSGLIVLSGHWHWDLHSNAVFCSDVMMSFPETFYGTKGIIHPEDKEALLNKLQLLQAGAATSLDFRIITTYGEIKMLKGSGLFSHEEPCPAAGFEEDSWEKITARQLQMAEEGKWSFRSMAVAMGEKLLGCGTWYFNSSTGETWYSDNVYRIYELMPQGLNPHLKTFAPFVHPEDAAFVTEAFDQAFQKKVPLHIEYRIIDSQGQTKYIQSCTAWNYDEKGIFILCGLVLDRTAQRSAEEQLEQTGLELSFQNNTARIFEAFTGTGSWQINLFTRKCRFSDNWYRLHGLKSLPASFSLEHLSGLVHPDDREMVQHAVLTIFQEHTCPDIEYRILRGDGKVRYIQFRGKPVIFNKSELIMAGTVRDITALKLQELKEFHSRQQLKEKDIIHNLLEISSGNCVWTWDKQTGKMEWSVGCFNLLGYKSGMIEPSEKLLLSFIHPNDKKKFANTLNLVLAEKLETEVSFRLLARGETRHLKAVFRIVEQDGKELFACIVLDQSGEVLLQEKLRERELIAEALGNVLDEIVFVTDKNHNILFVNKAGEAQWTDKELQGKNLFEVSPRLRNRDFMNKLQKAFSGKTISMPATVFLRHGGTGTYILVPLADESGEVYRLVHIVQNKSMEQELHQKLWAQLRLFEMIVEVMQERVIVMDRNMNYVYWNRKCEEYYGIRKEEVIGRNILEIAPGFYDDPSYNEFKRALNGEVVQLDREQESGSLSVGALMPVADESGRVVYVLWLASNAEKTNLMPSEVSV